MVRIAIAGGSGNVAREIVDVLVASKKHEILLLSRKDAPGAQSAALSWVKTDYEDTQELAKTLAGVHTVLSFIAPAGDQEQAFAVQKNLIDAAILAGVKRFAPSEWATSGLKHLSWYTYKGLTRDYLREVNSKEKVLEYSLFQPGFFLNYLTTPYKSSTHVHVMEVPYDFNNRRALVLDGGDDDTVTFTTVQDLAQVVAKAIDYEGEWPVIGGIKGSDLTIRQLIDLGQKIRGGTFAIEKLQAKELEEGSWKSSWIPKLDHPSIPPEQVDFFSRVIVAGVLLATPAGAYKTSDEWNRLLPEYSFTQPEQFLSHAWEGKP